MLVYIFSLLRRINLTLQTRKTVHYTIFAASFILKDRVFPESCGGSVVSPQIVAGFGELGDFRGAAGSGRLGLWQSLFVY